MKLYHLKFILLTILNSFDALCMTQPPNPFVKVTIQNENEKQLYYQTVVNNKVKNVGMITGKDKKGFKEAYLYFAKINNENKAKLFFSFTPEFAKTRMNQLEEQCDYVLDSVFTDNTIIQCDKDDKFTHI